MNPTIRLVSASLLLGISLITLSAQQTQQSSAPSSFAAGFRSDFLKTWDDFTKKMVALAEAMPEEKYSWRPGEGVRSVGEVFTHVASGSYFYLQLAGVQTPAGVDVKRVDSLKEKGRIIEALTQSCDYVKEIISKTTDADFTKPTKIFGREGTVREVYFMLATHQPEHLGQSIAYARMNGVVPPWTAERQARQQQPVKK